MKELKLTLNCVFNPKSQNQEEYIRTIIEKELVFCIGPAGSGKTACALATGIQYLAEKKIKKLILTRPTIETGGSLGYLPGGIREKMLPYLIPLFDELSKYLSKKTVEFLIVEDIIEIAPLQFCRGRTFHDAFIIVDEAQNTTFYQLEMITTRIGSRSKMVITGDICQYDVRTDVSPLEIWIDDVIGKDNDIPIVELDDSDIVRSDIVRRVLSKIRAYRDSR